MKFYLLIALTLLTTPMFAHADDDPMLKVAQENACMTCHAVDQKIIGPSFRTIAARFRNNPDAANYLFTRLQDGSVGDWGQIPMPPNPQANPADLHRLVQWVLTQ
jgi:cytochrome c